MRTKKLISVFLIVLVVSTMTMVMGNVFAEGESDEVYKLTFAMHSVETNPYCIAIAEWVDRIEEKSNGRLLVDVGWGGTLAAATDAVDMVRQGGADICWNTVSLNPGYFKYCNILSMYGEELSNAELTTYVYTELCKNEESFANEFSDIGLVLLGCHGMTPSLLSGNGDKIDTLDDFKGKSIQSISKTCITVLSAFGAAVQGAAPSDLYENLSKNVVSGTLVDASIYQTINLYEQFQWMNTYNYNSALAFIAMNADIFNSLPEDLQLILMDEFDTLSFACANYVDVDFTEFVENVIPENGIDVFDASDEIKDAVKEEYQTLIYQPWIENCEKAGYDNAAIVQEIEKLIGEGKEQYGEEYDWFK